MTRKDFEAIAAALHQAHQDIGDLVRVADEQSARAGVEQAMVRIERVLRASNERFDTERFFDACVGG